MNTEGLGEPLLTTESEGAKKLEVLEIADSEIGLTVGERNIIDSLTLPQIEVLKSKTLENFNAVKDDIVGFRSEDLFFLLSCIQANKLDTSGLKLREKEGGYFYLTPNPESSVVKNDIQLQKNLTVKKLHEAVEFNLRGHKYNEIAFTSAVTRNIIEKLSKEDQLIFEQDIIGAYEGETGKFPTESFFGDLIREVKRAEKDKLGNALKFPRRYSTIAILAKYIDVGIIDSVWEFLKKCQNRGGVIMGFNQKIIEGHHLTYGENVIHTQNEMAVSVPSHSVDLDCLEGFEVLGSFEEKVIKLIAKKEKSLKNSQIVKER